jgi:tocopherol cyclase
LRAEIDPFNTYQYKEGSTKPWFEWWYYKVVLPETNESYYFVYGVVNPWDTKSTQLATRSYVGMGDFKNNSQIEEKYPVTSFKASRTQTLVEIENQLATDQNFRGELIEKNSGNINSWDVSIQKDWAYNPTGWATGKGITDIEWYAAQAGAHCSGSIISNNKLVQFTNAPCYQDRNWGTDFPIWWTWIVSNQFKNNPDSVLAVGGGRPIYRGKKIPLQGVSIGLHHKGIDYHFRPNDLNIVHTNISFGKWEMSGQNEHNKVVVKATAPKEKFMDLKFMTPTGIVFHDYETLVGNVTVEIYKKSHFKWILVDELASDYAGIEYGSPSTNN